MLTLLLGFAALFLGAFSFYRTLGYKQDFIRMGDQKSLAEFIQASSWTPVDFFMIVFGCILILNYFGV